MLYEVITTYTRFNSEIRLSPLQADPCVTNHHPGRLCCRMCLFVSCEKIVVNFEDVRELNKAIDPCWMDSGFNPGQVQGRHVQTCCELFLREVQSLAFLFDQIGVV